MTTKNPSRNVRKPRVTTPKSQRALPTWERSSSGEEAERYRLYRLCVCFKCQGVTQKPRCKECRGEGRTLDRLAHSPTAEGIGLAIVTLADEGEFEGCPMGLLRDKEWLIKPWLPSPRNVTDAARVLAHSKKGAK